MPQSDITPAAILKAVASRHPIFIPRGDVTERANGWLEVSCEPIQHKVSPQTIIRWFEVAGALVLSLGCVINDGKVIEETVLFQVANPEPPDDEDAL